MKNALVNGGRKYSDTSQQGGWAQGGSDGVQVVAAGGGTIIWGRYHYMGAVPLYGGGTITWRPARGYQLPSRTQTCGTCMHPWCAVQVEFFGCCTADAEAAAVHCVSSDTSAPTAAHRCSRNPYFRSLRHGSVIFSRRACGRFNTTQLCPLAAISVHPATAECKSPPCGLDGTYPPQAAHSIHAQTAILRSCCSDSAPVAAVSCFCCFKLLLLYVSAVYPRHGWLLRATVPPSCFAFVAFIPCYLLWLLVAIAPTADGLLVFTAFHLIRSPLTASLLPVWTAICHGCFCCYQLVAGVHYLPLLVARILPVLGV